MVKHGEIKIDLDATCSRCGAKGAAQNGLCLKCVGDNIVNKLRKEAPMAEVKVTLQIDKMEAKVKIVEEKAEGAVVDRHLITTVTMEYEGTPAKIDDVLYALRAGHRVDAIITSPQLSLAGMGSSEGSE